MHCCFQSCTWGMRVTLTFRVRQCCSNTRSDYGVESSNINIFIFIIKFLQSVFTLGIFFVCFSSKVTLARLGFDPKPTSIIGSINKLKLYWNTLQSGWPFMPLQYFCLQHTSEVVCSRTSVILRDFVLGKMVNIL